MSNYLYLTKQLEDRIITERQKGDFIDFSFNDDNAIRRKNNSHDKPNVLRSNFIRDIDKILNCPFYNRYTDKTQVFSLNKNDDLTRRSLHVQLVSRIARTIGKALNLNLELIEAIALGHDIGHTPFGHLGEKILDRLYFSHTQRHFSHNVHSIRVLDKIFPLNLTLQTLDGIICHNGEVELDSYTPATLKDFNQFDERVEKCYNDNQNNKLLTPSTLEACVVRICDILAYLGKDRQDALISNLDVSFNDFGIGVINSEIINNLMVNIIENSYGKGSIIIEKQKFSALSSSKEQNYQIIYNDQAIKKLDNVIEKMMQNIYEKLLCDLENLKLDSPIFKHHIEPLNQSPYAKKRDFAYEKTEINQLIVDFIASMTDDYFVDLHAHLFPNSALKIEYKGYFK